jgi:hypothetical protein
MLHIESHVDGQDDLGQAYADKKLQRAHKTEYVCPLHTSQSSIAFEKKSIHTGVDSLDQMVDLAMDVSPACSEYASTMKKEVGEKLQEEAITGNGTRYKTVSLDTDTASLVLDKIADSSICLNHRRLQNYCSDETEKKNQSHICSRDRMVLLAEKSVVDDAVQNDRGYSGDAKLKKCPVRILQQWYCIHRAPQAGAKGSYPHTETLLSRPPSCALLWAHARTCICVSSRCFICMASILSVGSWQ